MSTPQRPVVVLAGASGFLGTDLARRFGDAGWDVRRIGRSGPDARWGDSEAVTRAVDGARLLVNLAGKSVNCRYTAANRAEIVRSRIETTAELHRAVAASASPPPTWMNASTATIYRHEEERANTESAGVVGEGFSVDVATAWERAFFTGETPGTRRIALRMAIVLGDGPATGILLRLARLGLGGPQYDGRWPGLPARVRAGVHHRYRPTRGRQHFSWIHVEDVFRSILFLEESAPEGSAPEEAAPKGSAPEEAAPKGSAPEEAAPKGSAPEEAAFEGPVNLASPHPSDNRELSRLLRAAVGRRLGLPAPRFALEPAMLLLRTEPELVLKSRWVVPERLEEAGFVFAHPRLAEALRDVVAG